MLVEVGFEGKRFAASSATVWLRVRVGLDVCPEIRFVRECFLADTALERFLTC